MDQDLLWCEDCNKSLPGDCGLHGPLIPIPDRCVPPRATLTAPSEISIRQLHIAENNQSVYGAFATCELRTRTVFGPLEADMVSVLPLSLGEDRLLLKRFRSGIETGYLDVTNDKSCNWLIYVRPARFADEQNLIAYQHRNSIFYATSKVIHADCELRVWYAGAYASLMGVSLLPTTAAENDSGSTTEIEDEEEPTAVSVIRPTSSLCNPEHDSEAPLDLAYDRSMSNSSEMILAGQNRRKGSKPQRVPQSSGPQSTGSSGDMGQDEVDGDITEEDPLPGWLPNPPFMMYPSVPPFEFPLFNEFFYRTNYASLGWGDLSRGSPFLAGMNQRNSVSSPEDSDLSVDQIDSLRSPESDESIDVDGDSDSEASGPIVGACNECGKKFSNLNSLSDHTALHADAASRPYSCTYQNCNKFFSSKYKLLRHELIHSQEKRHHCALCHKKFHRKDHLNNHLKVHERSKIRLECGLCGCIFAKKWTYEKHLALHERDQRQQNMQLYPENGMGEELDAKPPHGSSLDGHGAHKSPMFKKVPLSQKPSHPCEVCGKVFSASKDLRRHMQTHLGIKPNLCLFCPKKFTRKDHVRRHILTVHADQCREAGIKPAANSAAAQREFKRNASVLE